MKIKNTHEIQAFIKRCKQNINSNHINEYLDCYVNSTNEQQ
ncbi:hypothetical protein EVA_20392, partial [gut metagenome]